MWRSNGRTDFLVVEVETPASLHSAHTYGQLEALEAIGQDNNVLSAVAVPHPSLPSLIALLRHGGFGRVVGWGVRLW